MIAPVHFARLWDAGLLLMLALAGALASYTSWGMTEAFAGLAPAIALPARPPTTPWGPPAGPVADENGAGMETFLPQHMWDLSRDQAVAYNIASPLERLNPRPAPFDPERLSPRDLDLATDCMATAIYYEAASESMAGQLAVAQVILNRLRHPHFPKTVCGVVNQGSDRSQGCQFTFTCDGALARAPDPALFRRAHLIARSALHGAISIQAGQATHYHTVWIVPRWAGQLRKVAIVGHHVFYRPALLYVDDRPTLASGTVPMRPESIASAAYITAPLAVMQPPPLLHIEQHPAVTLPKADMPVGTEATGGSRAVTALTPDGEVAKTRTGSFTFGKPTRQRQSMPLPGF